MDLTNARELLHRINLLYARDVISADTRVQLREILAQTNSDAPQLVLGELRGASEQQTASSATQLERDRCHAAAQT